MDGTKQRIRTGEKIKWKSKGYSLSPEGKAKMMAEAATKLTKREEQSTELRGLLQIILDADFACYCRPTSCKSPQH